MDKIKLSQTYVDNFLKELVSKKEYYISKNWNAQETDTNFEATAILSTNDPATKDILDEKLSSYVNTYAEQASSKSPEGFTVLFDSSSSQSLGFRRINKLEAEFKSIHNGEWLDIDNPIEFQRRLPAILDYKEKKAEMKKQHLEGVFKGRHDPDDQRISIQDLQYIVSHIFTTAVQELKDYELSFTKRSKKYHRNKLFETLEGKEQQICNIFFQCVFATQETTELDNSKGNIPLSFLINNFIHQLQFDVCEMKPFDKDQVEYFLRSIIENLLKKHSFDSNFKFVNKDNSNVTYKEAYFLLAKSKPVKLYDINSKIKDYDILVLKFNSKLLCEDHFFTWDRHQVLPSSIPPQEWQLTKNNKMKLGDQVQPIPKISQMPCSNTHKSDLQVQTMNIIFTFNIQYM